MKALFMERPLFQIQHIDDCLNPALATTVTDYIKERWAAGRVVSPEIWRLLVGYSNDNNQDLLNEGLKATDPMQIKAIKLALSSEMSKENQLKEWNTIGRSVFNKEV